MTRDGPSVRLAKPVCHMTTQTEDAASDSGTEVEDVATMEMDDLDRFCDLHALRPYQLNFLFLIPTHILTFGTWQKAQDMYGMGMQQNAKANICSTQT